ncbi:MAG: FAD-binding oxidoreductase [Candidatus Thermoplasmatota archaeon]|jgi:sarcosine oxidase subunit beta|nr:FAD-binding oxidoreductase [Candidatus Thermoplasmatota archaeon]
MSARPERYDVVVVGAGVMGSALSYYLQHDHGWSVALCERDSPGAGASGKAGGLVSAQCWNDWDLKVVEESRKEYARLSEESGAGIYEETGGIRTASTEANLGSIERTLARLRANGVMARLLEPRELRTYYPEGEFSGVRSALFTPHDAVVLPTDLTQLYFRGATEAGSVPVGGLSEKGFHREGKEWVVATASGDLVSKRLVVAAGAWSKKVLKAAGFSAPLAPYLTRACLLKVGNSRAFPFFHDSEQDVYLRTYPGGDLLAGDGTELVEIDPDRFDSPHDMDFLENIARFMELRFPSWASAPVESAWRGVCTSTPDRRPLLGPYPGAEGLFLATGFNGFGLMRAGGAMRRLALGIATGNFAAVEPCLPARFPPPHSPFSPQPGFTLD